jgi:hypothetical protein
MEHRAWDKFKILHSMLSALYFPKSAIRNLKSAVVVPLPYGNSTSELSKLNC